MKLGETLDSIYSLTLNLTERLQGSEYPLAESAILLTMEDGTHEWVNFGARVEYNAELEFFDLPRADYFTLMAYLKAHVGSKIRFTLSNDAENPWTETSFLNGGAYFYATITGLTDQGEEEFSVSKQLFSVKIQIAYSGLTSTDVPNTVDTSLLDVCIEIDTVRANVIVTNLAALNATASPVGGWIGLTTSDHKVYIYDPSRSVWQFQYTLVADNAALGLVNGVFYLSAFADISSSSPGNTLGKLYKSGLINRESITFPVSGLDVSRGPGIETLEGFAFSMYDDDMFWKYVVDNRITLYDALVKQKLYDRTNARMVLNRTGANYNNSFDYHNYSFQVEPEILNGGKSFPDTIYTKTETPDAASEMIGKPIIATFGRWKMGELQASNFTIKRQKFNNGRRYLQTVSFASNVLTVDIAHTEFLKLLNIAAVGDYPGTNPVKYIYAQIKSQQDQPDVEKMIRVSAIASSGSNTALTLTKAYSVSPDGSAIFQIFMSVVELVIDDDPVVGMRKPSYLISTPEGLTTIPFELYGKINEDVERIPDSLYAAVGTDENKLTLNGNDLNIDDIGKTTVKDNSIELEKLTHYAIPGVLVPGSSTRTYDFGFIPDGIKSQPITEYPYGLERSTTRTRGVASSDRVTIAWAQAAGTGSYLLYRYKYPKPFGATNGNVAPYFDTKIQIPSITTTFYVDTALDPKFYYVYALQRTDNSYVPLAYSQYEPAEFEEGGGRGPQGQTLPTSFRLDPKVSSGIYFKVKSSTGGVTEATLVWNKIAGQRQVKIYRNDILIATLDTTTGPYLDATAYQVPYTGSTALNTYYIQVSNSNVGTNTDSWFIPDGNSGTDLWSLKAAADSMASAKYNILRDSNGNTESQRGYVVRTFMSGNGSGIPAAGVVYTWMLQLDRTKIPDLSNAKDVRILSDFVVRSYIDNFTQQPIFIQLRGVRTDGSSFVLVQHTSAGDGLAGKAQTKGAFLQFCNLPENKGGLDANYETEQQDTNVDGKYTGADMWRLPDWLFEDSAQEWNKIEYLLFAITNAAPIIPAAADSNQAGYKIGYGGLPGQVIDFTNVHKDKYFIEYVKEFETGLDTPQFARIDGGVIDNAAGYYTGTPYLIIERARHMMNYIVHKMLGYKPLYIGTEMKSRDNWICRYQSKESIDTMSMLELLCRNLWCCLVISPDDKLYARTLNIDEPRVNTVITFNQSRIIKDSVTRPIFRKQTEIFQQFKFKANYEPSVAVVAADPNEEKNKNRSYTEEIVVGWDLQKGTKIPGGFSRKELDADGNIVDNIDEGDEKRLYDLCKVSSFLYTTGGKINQYGYDKDQLLEFFYRPTKEDPKTGQLIEEDLPNLAELHGPMVKSPKRSLQDRIAMEVKFRVLNGWKFSFRCNLKYVIYDAAVLGLSDEAGTADNKLKKMDKVIFNHSFYTDGENLEAFVSNVEPEFYKGTAIITLYAPKPPGQMPGYIDHVWDASFGSRNAADYVFKNNDNGLVNEQGTFADAGYGSRNIANFKFPDGTLADSEGEGSGQI